MKDDLRRRMNGRPMTYMPGAATIPPEFNGYNRGCGVILVWTKEGGTY